MELSGEYTAGFAFSQEKSSNSKSSLYPGGHHGKFLPFYFIRI